MSEDGPVVYGGRYELHSRLARGGMADVYLARDQLLDRPVAVKVLFAQYASDPAFVERFRREAQAAANLNHPNVVGVFDWGEEGDTYYIVMEYVDGRSLSDVLRQEGTLLPARAADIGIDIAAALGFAHRNGVVHRDVKPGNVMLASDGQVKVTDFGIARAASSTDENLTQAGLVMGTATYFSPEQAQGKSVDPRSDVYSLGVVMYESVCGRPPFRGEDALAVAYQHVREQPPPPREINADIEPTLEAIIMKCLAKDPSARYPSAEDLRADLRRYREGNQISAASAGAAGVAAGAAAAAATQAIPATGSAQRYTVDETYYEEAPYEEPEDERNWAFIAVMILLLLVLGGVLFFLARALGIIGGDDDVTLVPVPNVVGLQLEGEGGARSQLVAAGFEVGTEFENDPDVDDGEVISQDPEGEGELEEGGTVDLVVSSGEAVVEIPDVVGFTQEDAVSRLGDAGFTDVTTELVFDDEVESGSVSAQDPAANSDAPLSAQITLSISQGADSRTVPNVAGRSADDAEGILEQAGFTVARRGESSASVPEDTVIGTDPAANTTLERGATVTLIVSAGPEQVLVPSVTEKTEETARSELDTAGFRIDVTETTLSPGDPNDGRVLSQDPAANTRVDRGSTVTITVGRSSSATSSTTTTTAP